MAKPQLLTLLLGVAFSAQLGGSRIETTDKPKGNPAVTDQGCNAQAKDEVILSEQQRELRRIAADLVMTRDRALAAARLVMLQEIEEAKAHPRTNPGGWLMKPETVEATRICALARDPDSVGLLIAAIDFIAPVHKMEGKDLPSGDNKNRPPIHKLFPANSALIMIGTPAVDPLVQASKINPPGEEGSRRRHFLQTTLAAIAGSEGAVRRFQEIIAREPTDAGKARLREALEEFQKAAAVARLTRKLNSSFTKAPSSRIYPLLVHVCRTGRMKAHESNRFLRSTNPFSVFTNFSRRVACVYSQLGVLHDPRLVVGRVVGEDEQAQAEPLPGGSSRKVSP